MTLDESFDPRRNSLNAFRLGLAALVVVSHSWLLSGSGAQPELGGLALGSWAVIGFFGLSGFLITRSRLSSASATVYYRNRVLRILPAFIVCILVVAFVLAPASVLLGTGASYSATSALTYVLTNLPLSLQFVAQKGIENTLVGLPVTGYWNGPLWTLFWEACCYVIVGVLVSVLHHRWLPGVVGALFGISTVVVALTTAGVLHLDAGWTPVAPLFVAFFAGSLAYLLRHRLDVSWPTILACLLVMAAATVVGHAAAFIALPVLLLMIRLSNALPLQRVGRRYDLSYGIYIYGWPVQQLIALVTFGTGLHVGWFVLLSLSFTVPLAMASSALVERPALRLKAKSPAPRVAAL
ncbi:acyltransferase family protein [Mycetocola zhadangensis]|uniref:Acyltransferase n=1 Tax=Mycetocola zhadangensis TaxID=1164595 RepID=A0A3L7IX05_9MICO|nr:acyltransferase [Mycetocola zhadangensis]RLQ82665.1 acyltransferase [Mycetocola zhadangensis]GGE99273.1 acyltransferase [Mycetocola zhadangensis]